MRFLVTRTRREIQVVEWDGSMEPSPRLVIYDTDDYSWREATVGGVAEYEYKVERLPDEEGE